MEEIITIINSVGFPIVACYYMAKRDEKTTLILRDLTVTLKGIEKTLEIKKEEKNEQEKEFL